MPYDNKPAGDSLEKPMESPEDKMLHIEKDLLPDGMKVAEGDIIEFKVVSPDDGGMISLVYNTPEKEMGSAGRNEAEAMTDDFKSYMSAREGEGQEPGMS